MAKKKNNAVENREEIKAKVLEAFLLFPYKAMNYKQVLKYTKLFQPITADTFGVVLEELVQEGKLEQVYVGKYRYKHQERHIVGTIELNRKGFAEIKTKDTDETVIIPKENLNHALHGDTVKVFLFAKNKKETVQGEVVEIIKRERTQYVGVIQISKTYAFVIPDNSHMPYDIFVPSNMLHGAQNGEKVIASITEWPKNAKNPIGCVITVLGKPGLHEVEMHAILAEFNLPYQFEEKIIKASEKISENITEAEIAKRRDFRNITTFTIDPIDAKDFDDALSIRKLDSGNWEVGIHIADVTHYIDEGSVVDDEGYERGTSVYLVDRCVPMLPERLSNFMCSLRPKEDKLCYAVVVELDENAKVLNTWYGRTIINSNRRFNYEEVQEMIEGKDGDLKEDIMICDMLAKKLRKQRFEKGSISFERPEVKFKLDEAGKPLGVFLKIQKDSNQLVEEFMLLANKKVAEYIGKVEKGKKARTFVYRVHDEPNPDKLGVFAKFIKKFGHKIKTTNAKTISETLNQVLHDVQGKAEQAMVENLSVRTMAKAEYSTENIGHYGLSFPHYTHFTSPIRRYPDMMVHRLLDKYINGGKSVPQPKYEKMCQHCSDRERLAAQAERASIRYKEVEFMIDKIGQVYEGVIGGVTEWGIYVTLDIHIEGMVPLRDLDDDYYIYDEENYCIVGRRNKKKFQLGDRLTVKVVRTDLERKIIDLALVKDTPK